MKAASAVVALSLTVSAFAVSGAHATPLRTAVDASSWERLCTPKNKGLEELSGLTISDGKIYAIGDSGTDDRVAELTNQCDVARWISVPVPRTDVEDLGSTPDGTLWLADIGDNKSVRSNIALIPMSKAGTTSGTRRLMYPDGAHNAEALLISRTGTPVIVTKDFSGTAGVYVPASATTVDQLSNSVVNPLRKAGSITFSRTTTPGGYKGSDGTIAVTGGAVSHDGTVAALRTYSDVYLYSAPDGDLVSALTSSTPVRVPLPSQPQGEAIAFTADGDLLSGSEANGGSLPPILILRGAADLVRPGDGGTGGGTGGSTDRLPSLFGS
ncbi:hypothetical protein ABH922_001507 [Rhodococcus sp. 27YEA15]|uniref:hypothetical protein n=1 Tax=Rhodococcus sp. 27YEA15 TaxID=3156259 RepID=UPI003C7B59C7